jgi:ribosome-binding factor A
MPRGQAAASGHLEPSQRQLRVAEQIRHLLAEDLMMGHIHDPRLEGVSVTIAEVRISRDLKHATVFAAELGRKLRQETLNALVEQAPRLAGHIARRMHIKFAPKLHFVPDETFDEASRMQRLIDDDKARLGLLDRREAEDDDDGRA